MHCHIICRKSQRKRQLQRLLLFPPANSTFTCVGRLRQLTNLRQTANIIHDDYDEEPEKPLP
jgi:hypothetical protein